MTVITEKRLDGGNTHVPTQAAGPTEGPEEQKYGLAQIAGLWPGIGESSLSSNRYALPGIMPKLSVQPVGAKAFREPGEQEIDLSQPMDDSAATEVAEKAPKPIDSPGHKKIVLSTDQKIKMAVESYFSDFDSSEDRQNVKQAVFDAMIAHEFKFIDLPIETAPNKTYRKKPQKALVEDVLTMSKLGNAFDFSDVRVRRRNTYLSIKELNMFDGKAVFTGVVKTEVEAKAEVKSPGSELPEKLSLFAPKALSKDNHERPQEKNNFGFFGKLFWSWRANAKQNDLPVPSSKESLPSKEKRAVTSESEIRSAVISPAERVVREYPSGIGVMVYEPYWENNTRIEHIGKFDDKGRLQGQGIARVPGLGVFHGEFRDGYPHGAGCLYYENGDRYEGDYDHGVGVGEAVFTTNGGRESTSKNTIHGLFRGSRIRELDPNLAHSNGPDSGEQQKQITEHNKDGTIELKSGKKAPGFFYHIPNYFDCLRVDGGYLTYKENPRKRGSYRIYRLTSVAGLTEHEYTGEDSPRSIYFGNNPVDKIDRGGDLFGKKKK